jgi:hypothetical protein
MSWSFCVHQVQLKGEVVVSFVDIGGIDDHHCFNFLFITTIVYTDMENIPWLFLFFYRFATSKSTRKDGSECSSNKANTHC